MTTESISEQNKKTVLGLLQGGPFRRRRRRRHRPLMSATPTSSTLPAAEDGVEGLRAFINGFLTAFPNAKGDIRRVLADGDIVAVHAHWTGLVSENGDVGIDMFRVENGKLVEHWDVFAPVPATSKNGNTVY